MTNTKLAYIVGKHFDGHDQALDVTLRFPVKNKLEKMTLVPGSSLYGSIAGLPLETLVDLTDKSFRVVATSDIADRTGKGDFQKGTIRDYISHEDQANRHLLLRDPLYFSVQKIRDTFNRGIVKFFADRDVSWVLPSILTKATEACEDVSTLFWTEYNNSSLGVDEKLALAQTVQLHLEAMCSSFGNIFSIAPSFRHELGKPTKKHLLEYWHVEAELVDVKLEGLMDFVEDMLKYCLESTLAESNTEVYFVSDALGFDKSHFENIRMPYERITYCDAITKLQGVNYINPETQQVIRWGEDFDLGAESIISEDNPVFVYHWPDELKAFYFTRFKQGDKILARSFDLLGMRKGEIVGGGEREHNYDEFKLLLDRQVEVIRKHNHDPKDYRYYEDLRLIGTLPHAGFGMGIERALAFVFNLDDVRMASLFPRDKLRVYP